MINKFKHILSQQLALKELFIITILLQFIIVIISAFKGIYFLTEGPGLRTAEATRYLAESWSFTNPEFNILYEKLKIKSLVDKTNYWQDVFSETRDGVLFPAHAPIMAVIALPFYLIFGEFGFLLLNQILVLILVYSLYSIILRLSLRTPCRGILLLFISTPLLFYINAFSYDLLAAVLIIYGLSLLWTSPYIAGVLISSSVFVRPTNIFYLIILLSVLIDRKQGVCLLKKSIISSFFILQLYFIQNYFLWGSILLSSRERMPYFDSGNVVFRPLALSKEILGRDLFSKFFSLDSGFLTYSPLLILLPFALRYFARSSYSKLIQLWCVIIIIQMLLIFSYECWNCSAYGSRYLLPCTYLLSLIVILYIQEKLSKGRYVDLLNTPGS